MQKSLDYARIMRFLLRLIDNPVFLRIMIRFNSEVCKDNTKIPGSLSRLATRKDPIYNKNVNSKMHKQNFWLSIGVLCILNGLLLSISINLAKSWNFASKFWENVGYF